MDDTKILEALGALDHGKDEDWTAAGLPAVDSVRALVGDDVTRSDIERVAAMFRRAVRADVQEPAQEPAQEPPPREMTLDERRAIAEREAKECIATIRAEKSEAEAMATEGKRRADDCDRRIAQVNAELEAAFPPLTAAERHRQVVQRGVEDRRQAAAEREAALAILGDGHKSPLDQAMAFRDGFGHSRPSYPGAGG
jgi:hypothetical protein